MTDNTNIPTVAESPGPLSQPIATEHARDTSLMNEWLMPTHIHVPLSERIEQARLRARAETARQQRSFLKALLQSGLHIAWQLAHSTVARAAKPFCPQRFSSQASTSHIAMQRYVLRQIGWRLATFTLESAALQLCRGQDPIPKEQLRQVFRNITRQEAAKQVAEQSRA